MSARVAFVIALLACAPAAMAHDVPWYANHDYDRRVTLEACRTDHRFDRLPDCQNAQTAETWAWERKTRQPPPAALRRIPTPGEVLDNPQYYAGNRWALAGTLARCASPYRWGLTESECAAARTGAQYGR